MITFECAWCDTELAIEDVDATSIECPACCVSVELAPDLPLLISAAA
jgi:hypothetical protein